MTIRIQRMGRRITRRLGNPGNVMPWFFFQEEGEMNKNNFLTVVLAFGLLVFSGCASVQTQPDYERSSESQMVVIQEKIGEGLKTGTLTPDQTQMYLTTLKLIRTDYTELRKQKLSRKKWNSLQERLGALGEEIDKALARTVKTEEPGRGERIAALQKRINDGRKSGLLPSNAGRDFQTRMDSIRSDYMRMTEGGKLAVPEEMADISRRLDALEEELSRFT